MSDENVGGLEASISAIETPEIGLHKLLVQRGADLSDLDRARVKRAIDALSAHGQPVVDDLDIAGAANLYQDMTGQALNPKVFVMAIATALEGATHEH